MPSTQELKYTLDQLIDLESLRPLIQSFGQLAGIPLSIMDPSGNPLITANWLSVCSQFHRKHPETQQRCVESDQTPMRHHAKHGLGDGAQPIEYVCQNGMNCVALPIMVEGYYLGDLFFSQYFTHPPDEQRFRRQAEKYNFDPDAYWEAVQQVKVRSRDDLRQMLDFNHQLVELIASLGAQTLRDLQSREKERCETEALQRQNTALLTFNRQRHSYLKDLPGTVPKILQQMVETLAIERASLWLYSKDRQQLFCRYEWGGDKQRIGTSLDVNKYPAFFEALERDREAVVANIHADPRTANQDIFWGASNTSSILDVALWRGEEVLGMLCCSHVGNPRVWRADEERFAHSVADFLSQLLETDRRQRVELALKESERRLTTLMDHLPGVVYRCAGPPSWELTFVSQGVFALTGYTPEEFVAHEGGLSLDHLVHPDDRVQIRDAVNEAIAHHNAFEIEYRITDRDGIERWLWEQGQAVRSAESGDIMLEGFISDITEQKRVEQFKEEMLSVVSHELRTPLTSMLGFSELLLENELTPDQTRDVLQTVHKETDRLHEMVENLLDLQQLRAGRLQFGMQKLDLSRLYGELGEIYEPLASSHPLLLDWADDLPMVWGDEERLLQVLRNLVSNAVKYSPEGGPVTLGSRREASDVVFWVQDRGIGIPEEKRQLIFERFYRIDTGDRRRAVGVGLGLALVKEIVDAHKGRVWMEPVPEGGSTFYVTLPVLDPSPASE